MVGCAVVFDVGGGIGCLLAFPMNGFSTGTGQTQSFSEIAFAFRITPQIVGVGMAFAVVMGVLGGLLPALRAARLPITSADVFEKQGWKWDLDNGNLFLALWV